LHSFDARNIKLTPRETETRLMNNKLIWTTLALVLCLMQPIAMADEVLDRTAVCAGCHGPNGHSRVPDNPILAAQNADYLVNALRAYISGERDYGIMKTLAGRLSARDIEVIAAYYAAQAPIQSPAAAPGDAARGEALVAVCVACHGPAGHSVIPANPSLAGQHAKYLSGALTAYKNGGRSNPVMASMTASLSEQDIEDIAAYYSAQPVQATGDATTAGGEPQ
jgi:cytochrome c553